jgi:molybdopterin converting factor small subunit
MSDTTATVRLFAALRDAAGTGEVSVPAPTTLPALLALLAGTYGERFAARLEIAAVMLDGLPVDRSAEVTVPAGSEVALLPPFAGG